MTLLSKWIDLSLLQGQVYDDIFSPRALLQPESIREARARALATDLQRVFETMGTAENQVLELRRQLLVTTCTSFSNGLIASTTSRR